VGVGDFPAARGGEQFVHVFAKGTHGGIHLPASLAQRGADVIEVDGITLRGERGNRRGKSIPLTLFQSRLALCATF
jgi:hypothetical protein